MTKLTKNQRNREKIKAHVDQSRQSTLDNPLIYFETGKFKVASKPQKLIVINDITNVTKEDELEFKIGFSLFPSKALFSRVNLDLYFNEQLLNFYNAQHSSKFARDR